MDISILVRRKMRSYDYKRYPNEKDSWNNNNQNNMLDIFDVYHGEGLLYSVKCQTIANIPGGIFMNTIAPGPFKIQAFVPPRAFYGRIHGICDTKTLSGDNINSSSIHPVMSKDGRTNIDFARWLVHDTQKCKPDRPMQLCRAAWSAGCFILKPSDLEGLGSILEAYKLHFDDYINGELLEEQ